MTDLRAFYHRIDESAPGGSAATGLFASTPNTRGPWDPRHQHAGPPAALLVRAVQRLGHGPDPGLVARATMEILAPIPVDDVRVVARVVREGRRIAWCQAAMYAARRVDAPHRGDDPEPDQPVARLSAWLLRTTTDPLPVPPTSADPPPASEGVELEVPEGWGRGYLDAVEWRWVEGTFQQPGPATVWTRLLVDLVAGEQPTGVQRVLAVADAGSGVSAVADPRSLLFVNTELTVHLLREPVGDRISIAARTLLDPAGVGLANSVLGDERGQVGTGAQSLFVDRR